jgi:5-oxoprolinase (ATP-hydrolysing)/N-methylhydantoinase A
LGPTSAANTSVELLETRAPILVVEKSYIADTAGPEQQPGGLGQMIRARKLFDDDRPAQVGLYPSGVLVQTQGLFGVKRASYPAPWCAMQAARKYLMSASVDWSR